MSDTASVLAVHSIARWITGVVSGVALVLFSVQLYWDRKILAQMFFDGNIKRIAVHRSTRVCGSLNALLQVIASVDTLGVFGIYHVQLRIVLRLLSFLTLQPPLYFWVFFSVKPLFPFLFSDERVVLRRLKYFLIGYGSLSSVLYAIFYYTTEPAYVITATAYSLLYIALIWVLNVAVHVRARRMIKSAAGLSKSSSRLTKVLRSWVRQSAIQSLILLIPFGIFAQLMLQSISHIGLGESRPDYLERNFTSLDSLDTRAIVGIGTSIMFSLFNWLYLITSWRNSAFLQAEFDKSTSLKRGKLSGSGDSNTSATTNCGTGSGYASAEDTDVDAMSSRAGTKSVDAAFSPFSEDNDLVGEGRRSSLASSSQRNSRALIISARNSVHITPKRNSQVSLHRKSSTVREAGILNIV